METINNKLIRLQKFIADCGITSRRKAELLITEGKVTLNGKKVTELGTKVDPKKDAVSVDGQFIDQKSIQKIYLVMNKPRGCVTTLNDPEERPTVMNYCQEISERIYPVGRLDYLSEGLLILTNDGELANNIIHPSREVVKVYEVKIFGVINNELLDRLRNGVSYENRILKPLSVRVIGQLQNKTWLEFRLQDGKNREIRRICEECDLTVDKLKRVAIGNLSVDGIRPGSYRMYTKKELLKAVEGLSKSKDARENMFKSSKKTINIGKKGIQRGSLANNYGFQKLRRDVYFESLREIKLRQAEEKKINYRK